MLRINSFKYTKIIKHSVDDSRRITYITLVKLPQSSFEQSHRTY